MFQAHCKFSGATLSFTSAIIIIVAMLLFSAIFFHSATEIDPYSLYRKKVISAFKQRKMMICLLQALSGLEKATISIQCVCAHALERGLMMQKLCTVGIRNAILRNQSYLDCEALHQQLVKYVPTDPVTD